MDDLQRTGDSGSSQDAGASRGSSLFDSTRKLAGETAAKYFEGRRAKILQYLDERGPATLFEIAAHYGYFDHQISGRFTELAREGLIERTGERRTKPETQCVADVWRLRGDDWKKPVGAGDLAEKQGYPQTIFINGEGMCSRAPMLPSETGPGGAPGIPYSLNADSGGLRMSYRVVLVECEGCGRPLRMAVEKIEGKDRKVYRCGTPACGGRAWFLELVKEPGRAELLALVMKRL